MRLASILTGAGLAILTGQPSPLLAQVTAGQTPVSGACHVSPIVADLDKSARFYHDLIGLDLVPAPPAGRLPVDDRPEHLALHGLPQATLRFVGARMPGVVCGVELVEFTGVERAPVTRRMQDPGSAMLILLVRDVDAIFARLKRDGVAVVTAGGAPVTVGASKTRVVVVKDPDGHFVELAQLDPPPANGAAASSSVLGIRLRVTVENTDRTIQYYRDVFGVEVQDPGSYRLQLNVRDIAATIGALERAGSRVISSGGVPVGMTFGASRWRLAVAQDLNNLFVIVQQRLAPDR